MLIRYIITFLFALILTSNPHGTILAKTKKKTLSKKKKKRKKKKKNKKNKTKKNKNKKELKTKVEKKIRKEVDKGNEEEKQTTKKQNKKKKIKTEKDLKNTKKTIKNNKKTKKEEKQTIKKIDDELKILKDKMTSSQFKELIEFWNRYHAAYLPDPSKNKRKSKSKSKIEIYKGPITEESKKVAEAELLIMEAVDTSDLDKKQKNIIDSIKTNVQKIIKGYEKNGELDKKNYDKLIKYINKITYILKNTSGVDGETLNYIEKIKSLEKKIEELKSAYTNKGSLEKQELGSTIVSMKKNLKTWKNLDNKKIIREIHKGLVFKVQIGAYRKRNLRAISDEGSSDDILSQEDINDIHQYTMRTFRNYWKANEFKKQMRDMGLKDSYIIAVIDGNRVPIKQVEKTIKKQKQELKINK